MRILVQMIDALGVERRRAPHDAVHVVVVLEKQLGEIRAILARDSGDERALSALSGHSKRADYSSSTAMPILRKESDLYPDDLFSIAIDEAPWQIVHVRSRQEKAVARLLAEWQQPFYLPQIEKSIRR